MEKYKELCEEIYQLNINKEKSIQDEELGKIVAFISDRTAYDYYCEKCKKIKTFIQNKDKNIIVKTTFGYIDALNMYTLQAGEKKIEYTTSQYSTFYEESFYKDNSEFYIFKFFECPTCENRLVMIFLFKNKMIRKVYQSFISNIMNTEDIIRYQKMKLLDSEDLMDLNKANECKKNGLNIAAFVYMRRIFENMLQRIYNKNKIEIHIKDESKEFTDLYVKDKVKLLKEYLPTVLNENSKSDKYTKIYKILSEGIHKLDEETCENLYNMVKDLLLLILERECELQKEKDSIKELDSNFNKIFNSNK